MRLIPYLALLCFSLPCLSQKLPSPSFDAVSIKPSEPGARGGGADVSGSRFIARNMTLRALVALAYTHSNSQILILGGPSWLDREHFDIEAKEDGDAVRALRSLGYVARFYALQPLIQSMLVDRFHLKVRSEPRTASALAVVVTKTGVKMHPSVDVAAESGVSLIRNGHPDTEVEYGAVAEDMDDFAEVLSHTTEARGMPVLNHTNLTAKYDFRLLYTPERSLASSGSLTDSTASAPSLYEALKSQLGLELIPAKAKVLYTVVVSASEPTPN